MREVKDRFSEYLRQVRAGEEILITDRGRVVALLGPPGPAFEASEHPLLEVLFRAGRATRGAPNRPELYQRTGGPGISREELQRLLDEEREDR